MHAESLPIERALELLGQRLGYMGAPPTLLLVGGGAALNLLGLVTRTTKDVDVIALVHPRSSGVTLEKADPLPAYLREASEQVARDLGLPLHWLNPGPTSLLDQIHLKLYAAVDQRGGRHLADLLELRPTADELLAAARWAKTHDPSPGFHQELVGLLKQISHDDVAEQL